MKKVNTIVTKSASSMFIIPFDPKFVSFLIACHKFGTIKHNLFITMELLLSEKVYGDMQESFDMIWKKILELKKQNPPFKLSMHLPSHANMHAWENILDIFHKSRAFSPAMGFYSMCGIQNFTLFPSYTTCGFYMDTNWQHVALYNKSHD